MGLNKTTYSIKSNPLESNSSIGNKTIFLESGNKIELFDSSNIGEEQLEEIKFLVNKDDFNSGFYNIQGEDFYIQKYNGNFLVFSKTTENFSEKNILKQIGNLREKYVLYTKEVNDFLEEHKLELLNILGDEEQNKQKIENKKQQIFDEVKKIVLEIKNLNSEDLQKSLLEDLGKAIDGQVDLNIIEKEVEYKNTKNTIEETQDEVEIPEWLKGTGLEENSEDNKKSENTETSSQSDKKQVQEEKKSSPQSSDLEEKEQVQKQEKGRKNEEKKQETENEVKEKSNKNQEESFLEEKNQVQEEQENNEEQKLEIKNHKNQTEDDDKLKHKVNNDKKTIKKAILKGDEIIELEMSYENGEDETNKKILDENKYYFVGEFDGKFIYEKQKSALNILLPKRIKKLISQTTKQVLNTISLPRMASKFKIELENGSILIYFDKNGKLLEKSESFEKVDSIIRTIRNNLEKAYKKFIQGEDIENVFPASFGVGIKNREEFLKHILKEFIKGKLSIGVSPKIAQKFSKEVLENLKQEDQEETGGLRKKIKNGFDKYFGFGLDEEENEEEIKEDKEEGGNTDSSFEDFVLEKEEKTGVLKNIFSRKNKKNSEIKDNFDYNNIDLSQYTEKYKTEKNENIFKIKVKFDILQDILTGKKDKKLFEIFSKKLENGIDLGGGVILGEKDGKVTYFRKKSNGVLEEDTSIKGNLTAGQKARFLEEMGFLDNDFIDKKIKQQLEL